MVLNKIPELAWSKKKRGQKLVISAKHPPISAQIYKNPVYCKGVAQQVKTARYNDKMRFSPMLSSR